jgi:hypothetical protein
MWLLEKSDIVDVVLSLLPEFGQHVVPTCDVRGVIAREVCDILAILIVAYPEFTPYCHSLSLSA